MTTNCNHIAITTHSTIDAIAETISNVTLICNQFHLLITEDQRIFIHVKNTNAIALTFMACALLLFFYSCCWFNRFSMCLCETPPTPDTITRSDADRDSGPLTGNSSTIDVDQTHSPEQTELSRRYDMDLESVSLPSYTICSGLPTYDDALDQFRKHGIYIQQPSVVKLFEESNTTKTAVETNDDNISMNSTCTCGGNSTPVTALPKPVLTPNYIELNPDQLQMLSQQRLSLQIALNSSIRRSNRNGRIDLCRQVNRSNLLRSHDIPQIHRSASQQSLCHDHLLSQRLRNSQHRGSLC